MSVDAEVEDLARTLTAAVLGPGCRVDGTRQIPSHAGHVVLVLTVSRPRRRLVLKAARGGAGAGSDFERTASLSALARAAGAPVPSVLSARTSPDPGGWSHLLQDHVDGVVWRDLHPSLPPEEVMRVHRQLAHAVLAVQTVGFGAFGELTGAGEPATAREPAGLGLVQALHRRAGLRIRDPARRAMFDELLDDVAQLFPAGTGIGRSPTLCHDDLHHGNVVLAPKPAGGGWRLVALLDWDTAWAGPAECDVARMAFWDGMTGPGFWDVYRAAVPSSPGAAERALVHQLQWCLEHDADTPRHRADTAALVHRLRGL